MGEEEEEDARWFDKVRRRQWRFSTVANLVSSREIVECRARAEAKGRVAARRRARACGKKGAGKAGSYKSFRRDMGFHTLKCSGQYVEGASGKSCVFFFHNPFFSLAAHLTA